MPSLAVQVGQAVCMGSRMGKEKRGILAGLWSGVENGCQIRRRPDGMTQFQRSEDLRKPGKEDLALQCSHGPHLGTQAPQHTGH